MDRALGMLTSPAAAAGLAAAVLWPQAFGSPSWTAAARGRFASTLALRLAVGGFVFVLVRRLGATVGG